MPPSPIAQSHLCVSRYADQLVGHGDAVLSAVAKAIPGVEVGAKVSGIHW